MRNLTNGEIIQIRKQDTDDDWCLALVVVASQSNPQSVMLELYGMVRASGGFIGSVLPITVDYENETVIGLMTQDLYEIEVQDSTQA